MVNPVTRANAVRSSADDHMLIARLAPRSISGHDTIATGTTKSRPTHHPLTATTVWPPELVAYVGTKRYPPEIRSVTTSATTCT